MSFLLLSSIKKVPLQGGSGSPDTHHQQQWEAHNSKTNHIYYSTIYEQIPPASTTIPTPTAVTPTAASSSSNVKRDGEACTGSLQHGGHISTHSPVFFTTEKKEGVYPSLSSPLSPSSSSSSSSSPSTSSSSSSSSSSTSTSSFFSSSPPLNILRNISHTSPIDVRPQELSSLSSVLSSSSSSTSSTSGLPSLAVTAHVDVDSAASITTTIPRDCAAAVPTALSAAIPSAAPIAAAATAPAAVSSVVPTAAVPAAVAVVDPIAVPAAASLGLPPAAVIPEVLQRPPAEKHTSRLATLFPFLKPQTEGAKLRLAQKRYGYSLAELHAYPSMMELPSFPTQMLQQAALLKHQRQQQRQQQSQQQHVKSRQQHEIQPQQQRQGQEQQQQHIPQQHEITEQQQQQKISQPHQYIHHQQQHHIQPQQQILQQPISQQPISQQQILQQPISQQQILQQDSTVQREREVSHEELQQGTFKAMIAEETGFVEKKEREKERSRSNDISEEEGGKHNALISLDEDLKQQLSKCRQKYETIDRCVKKLLIHDAQSRHRYARLQECKLQWVSFNRCVSYRDKQILRSISAWEKRHLLSLSPSERAAYVEDMHAKLRYAEYVKRRTDDEQEALRRKREMEHLTMRLKNIEKLF